MNDPYKILNVPSTATDEEVKKAYRELARKYHPDNYHDSPLEDLAQEKMKEINEAYDTIMKMRGGGHGAGRNSAGSGYGAGYGGYAGAQAGPRFSGDPRCHLPWGSADGGVPAGQSPGAQRGVVFLEGRDLPATRVDGRGPGATMKPPASSRRTTRNTPRRWSI